MSTETELTIDGVDLVITYTETPYIPARLWGPPEDCYPAEGGELEVQEVHVIGSSVDISPLLSDAVIAVIENHLSAAAA